MKIGTVAGTNDSTTTIATNDMVQEHVTNFTKELFGYIANGIGDDISSIAWICPYISRHLLSLTPSLAHCRRYSRGER
ncbi:protein [Escherichia coli]|nr:protein [Escherichia coli]